MVLLRLGWWISGWCDKFPYSSLDIQRNPSCLIWIENGSSMSHNPTSYILDVWKPPNQSHIKWNINTSVNPLISGSAIGGVLRDHKGNFVCLFSSPILFMEINCAEILAIQWVVSISIASESTKKTNIVLESDSHNDVTWCNNDEGGPWNMKYHLNFIQNTRNFFGVIHHPQRERHHHGGWLACETRSSQAFRIRCLAMSSLSVVSYISPFS